MVLKVNNWILKFKKRYYLFDINVLLQNISVKILNLPSYLIQGELYKEVNKNINRVILKQVRPDDCFWTLEDNGRLIRITLEKVILIKELN